MTKRHFSLLMRFLTLILILMSSSVQAEITLVGVNTDNSGNPVRDSITLTKPPGVSDGTLLVVQISLREGGLFGTEITPPAPVSGAEAWTLLRRDFEPGFFPQVTSAIYYKFHHPSDSEDFTFTLAPSRRYSAAIIAYDGVDPDDPIDVHGGQTTNSSRTITAPSVTPTTDNARILWLYSYARGDSSGVIGVPTAGTTRYATSTSGGQGGGDLGVQIRGADLQQATAAATGTQTAFFSTNNPRPNIGQTIALRPDVVPAPDPVAFYQMEESEWTGATNEVTDSSGNNRHGTAEGGATTAIANPAIPGSPGTCRYGRFDGVDDYVQVPNLSNILSGTASLAFWIRTTQTGNDIGWQAPGVTGVEQAGGADDIFWGWLDASGRIGLSVGNDFNDWKSDTSINNGEWHHVVLTRDHVAGTFDIYVNGVLENSGSIATGLIGTPFSSIGRIEDTGGPGNYLEADLDEVRIYDAVLTDAQVVSVMNEVRPCPEAEQPIVHYHMDEGSWNGTADEVEDFSGNNLHATAINGATTDNTDPARPGTIGTCGYGVFNSNQRVEAANTDLINDAESVSVAMWFRMDGNNQPTPQNWQTMLSYGGVTFQDGGRFEVYRLDGDGRLHFEIRRTDGSITSVSIPGTVFNNEWQHVVASFDRDELELRIWLNGALAATETTADLGLADVTGPLTVGSASNHPAQGITGNIDEVRVYDFAVSQEHVDIAYNDTRPCAETLIDHIRIVHSGSALTCTPAANITIQACADAACDTLHTGTVTTTLTPTGWVGGDTIVFDGGSTTAALKITTPGTVTLGSTASTPVAVNPTQCVGGLPGQPCDLEFHDSGFIFNVPNLTACSTSADITVSAVRMDETTQTCAPAFSNITKPVNFWSGYLDPGTGAAAVEVNGTPIAGASPGTSFNLTFDANAETTITVGYPDAGQMQLHARHDGTGDDAGLVMIGSDSFISVPHSMVVYATDDCPAGDVTCPVFDRAGQDFQFWVKAACDGAWVSDPNVDPQTIPATPNFRMSNIPITHDLIAPDPGNLGALGVNSVDFGLMDNGVVLLGQSVSEVGVFTFTATPPDTGDPVYNITNNAVVPGGTSRNIGRFTPFDFDVTLDNSPEFEPGCDNVFTYMDQAFDYATAPQVTITARNAFGNKTLNYDADWWMLDDFIETESHAGAALPGAVTLDSAMAGHSAIDCAGGGCEGEFTTTFHGPFTYMRNGDPQDPFAGGVDIEFSIVDSDGVSYPGNPFLIEEIGFGGGSDEQRWGRLRLRNAGGSELLPLSVPVLAEYYDEGYRLNSEDSCTVLTLADDIRLSNPETEGGDPQPGTAAMTVGGDTSSVTSGDVTLADGVGQLLFSAPDEGNVGYIDITTLLAGDLSHLLSDWEQAGILTANPRARATFGIYEGSRSFIYTREPW